MGKTKLTKNQKLGVLSIFLMVSSFAAERFIELFAPKSKPLAIILAMIFTVLLAAVTYILYNCEDSTLGLMASLIGYKMAPVSISFIGDYSPEASLLYSYVRYIAIVIFAVMIYRFFIKQRSEDGISAPVIFALMFAVPFLSQLSALTSNYFFSKTGSMLLPYFTSCFFYALATVVIIAIAYVSGMKSLRFAVGFEYFAILLNALKACAKIGYRILNDWHISKSLYLWLAVYALLAVMLVVVLKFKEKKALKA